MKKKYKSPKTRFTNEHFQDLLEAMEGFGGNNWQDDYPGFDKLTFEAQVICLEEAVAEHRS